MAPLVRRTWGPKGYTPILHQRTRSYKKVSAIAALCVTPHRDRLHLYFRLHSDTNINAVLVIDFLRQLRKQVKEPVVLLWDRLLAHRAQKVQKVLHSTHICDFYFPPYAPELNPVEYIWSYLKMNPMANFAPADIDTLLSATRHHSRSLQRKQDLLRSFMKHCPLSLRLK